MTCDLWPVTCVVYLPVLTVFQLTMMFVTSKHVLEIKKCRNFLKDNDLLSAVSTFWFQTYHFKALLHVFLFWKSVNRTYTKLRSKKYIVADINSRENFTLVAEEGRSPSFTIDSTPFMLNDNPLFLDRRMSLSLSLSLSEAPALG